MVIKKSVLFLLILASTSVFSQLEVAQYSIKNLKVNTPYSDLSVSFWGKGRVVYSSSRNSKTLVTDNNKDSGSVLQLFSAYIDDDYELKYSKEVSMGFDSNFNQSNVSFSPDLQYVYFTLNDQKNTNRRYLNLKIYRAKVSKTGEWSDLEELPFNSYAYSCAHPSISEDGTKLYFASNMPGGYGDTDLYVVDIYSNGKFGRPQNLGGMVNSSAKETFPEINGGLLYFSSNRSHGLGGLDIYVVPTGNLFIEPQNVGEPINSAYDDFSFVINGNFRKGYFTSNRPQGKGGDDIYTFVQETAIKNCSQDIEVMVVDQDTGERVNEAEVNFFDADGKWINRFTTNQDGLLSIKINKCNKDYKLEAFKSMYSRDKADVIYAPDKTLHQITMQIYKDVESVVEEPIVEEAVSDLPDDMMFIEVETVEFLLNKYDITVQAAETLDKVVKFMKEHPTVVVEFSSHTDCRGPDQWNLELTKYRVQEVIGYIVGKGIDYRRIYGKGYGESMPVNHCVNGVECTDAQHAENRRTEFFILAK